MSSQNRVMPYRRRPIRRYRKYPLTRPLKRPAYVGYGAYKKKSMPVSGHLNAYSKMKSSKYSKPASILGGIVGAPLGGPMGLAAGSLLGAMGADVVKYLTGFGDYVVKQNSFQDSILSGEIPQVNNTGVAGGGTRIRFREYIKDIISSSTASAFSVDAMNIVPSDTETFPWLSQIAGNFQEWIPHGIIFEFRSMSADALNSTNTALGQVIMATNYNSTLSAYGSKGEMENSEFSKSIKPSESCIHMIECARSASVLSNLYVDRSTAEDERFSMLGKFQIATNGVQGTSVNLGELWISYDIELLKPKIYDLLGKDQAYASFVTATGVDATHPLGTANTSVYSYSGYLQACACDSGGTILTIPATPYKKVYAVYWQVTGSSTGSLVNPARTLSSNLTSISSFTQSGTITSTSLDVINIVQYDGQNASSTITFGTAGTFPASVTVLRLYVIECHPDFPFS